MKKNGKIKNKKLFFNLITTRDQIIALVCVVAIVSSVSLVVVKAVGDLSAPAPVTNIPLANTDLKIPVDLPNDVASETGSFSYAYTDELLASGSNQTCCGTAARNYTCSEKSFGEGTFCKPPSVKIKPDIVNFPGLGSSVYWRCQCNPRNDRAMIEGTETKPIYSFCFAKRDPEPGCFADNLKTIMLEKDVFKELFYDEDGVWNHEYGMMKNINGSKLIESLCKSGKAMIMSGTGDPGVLKDGAMGACVEYSYICACEGSKYTEYISLPGCLIRYCYGDTDTLGPTTCPSPRCPVCGDALLDKHLGEECERAPIGNFELSNNGLFGHSCRDKGLCGQIKCTDKCKLDYSDCVSCGDVNWADEDLPIIVPGGSQGDIIPVGP